MKLTLEHIIRSLINESIDGDAVIDSINNRYYVRIKYDDTKKGSKAKKSRLIQPMAFGTTKKGHPVLRAYQLSGGSRRGVPRWKFFRLDRITSWKPMPNKHFVEPPSDEYGKYNLFGDETMGIFQTNAKFDNLSPLEREKTKFNAPKMSTKNVDGPISAAQQWKKNVYTSQPNSEKYKQAAKNIDATSDEINRFDDDIWAAAERERDEQNKNSQGGPITQQQSYDFDRDDYDVDDVDFDEDEFFDNMNKSRY